MILLGEGIGRPVSDQKLKTGQTIRVLISSDPAQQAAVSRKLGEAVDFLGMLNEADALIRWTDAGVKFYGTVDKDQLEAR